jgi:hypothetical protein
MEKLVIQTIGNKTEIYKKSLDTIKKIKCFSGWVCTDNGLLFLAPDM